MKKTERIAELERKVALLEHQVAALLANWKPLPQPWAPTWTGAPTTGDPVSAPPYIVTFKYDSAAQ
jgi:hypothetical protein